MIHYRRSVCLLLAAILMIAVIPCSASAETDRVKVRIGYYEDGDYMNKTKDGNYTGFNFEYLQKIAQYAGWEYEVIDCKSWDNTEKMLKEGKIDILPAVYHTKERSQAYSFSQHPMCNIYTTLNVRADDTRYGYEDFASFKGMNVGVIKNTMDADFFEQYCSRNSLSVKIHPYLETADLLADLDIGTLDAVAITHLGKNSIFRSVANFSLQPIYFTVDKDNKKVLSELDAAMDIIKLRDPYYESRLYEKYFSVSSLQDPVFTNEEIEYIKNKGTVKAVYSSKEAPLEHTDAKSGAFTGTVADLFRSISDDCGLKFQFLPVENRADSFQTLNKGDAEIICSISNEYLWSEQNQLNTTTYFLRIPYVAVNAGREDSAGRIALPEGYAFTQKIVNDNRDAEILYYPTIEACFEALDSGEADVAYANTYVANYLLADSKYKHFRVVTLPNFTEDLGIGVSKDADPRLFAILDKCIQYTASEQIDSWVLKNSTISKPFSLITLIRDFPAEAIALTALIFLIIIGVLVYILITKSRNNKRYLALLYRDSVTGIGNLNKFRLDADAIIREAGGHAHAIVYLDIEQFKTINDSFGFAEGDGLLRALAQLLEESASAQECCARVSADQFVLLWQYKNWPGLALRTDWISREINEFVKSKGKSYNINLVFGVYIAEEIEESDISPLLDFANYARRSGKNAHKSVTLRYDEKMRQEELWRRHLSDVMKPALQSGEFTAYFQPKFDMVSQKVIGSEALVRWLRPNGEVIHPGQFIPFFEKNGFITELDLHVYEEACRLLQRWKNHGRELITISSNFSRLHFKNPGFPLELAAIADRYGVPRKFLEVEITESIIMEEIDHVQEHLAQLKQLGFQISIDDFGSGYSSLGILQQLTADTIKLDRSLLFQGADEKRKQIIIRGIITMAHELGFQIICEGVETKEQIEMLISMDCRNAQGFYFAEPMPLVEFEKILW